MDVLHRPPSQPYSPQRRTALVLSGTGAHGAYHAGVLRALHEGGVKIDVVAGHGIGAAGAALAAIDGGTRLWDPDGVWRGPRAGRLYRWRWTMRAAGWLVAATFWILLIPLLFLGVGVLIALAGFLLELLGTSAGGAVIDAYGAWLHVVFTGDRLPILIPRALAVVLSALLIVLLAGALSGSGGASRRRDSGQWWWRLMAFPLDCTSARDAFAESVWQLIRGASSTKPPSGPVLSRRYAETLAESLGQPGFRELLVVATDLDARQDVAAALLRDSFRRTFVAPRPGRERKAEVLDLAGAGREQAFEVVAAALTPIFGADPQLVTFPPDSYWRGETHRLCDRPGIVLRLLDELRVAGVAQIILVTATPVRGTPHRLSPWNLDFRRRLGDSLAAAETAALRDAIDMAGGRFDAVYQIGPEHNPIGPLDLDGAYDEASDRRQTLEELMEHGYEDAHRQFIEPIVGASGEHFARAET